jgi:predicted 3-demethylubiquinone-9 3-methyltransferase (glyoxalase superfamily)
MKPIVPNLWFDTEAEEAAELYTSIFEGSRITAVTRYGEAGPREAGMVMTVSFELRGQPFVAINGGPEFEFNESISLEARCADQDEIDRLWTALTDGGQEVQCGWLRDRYGVAWQVTPDGWEERFPADDPEAHDRMMRAMLGMVKLDIAELERAYRGE